MKGEKRTRSGYAATSRGIGERSRIAAWTLCTLDRVKRWEIGENSDSEVCNLRRGKRGTAESATPRGRRFIRAKGPLQSDLLGCP